MKFVLLVMIACISCEHKPNPGIYVECDIIDDHASSLLWLPKEEPRELVLANLSKKVIYDETRSLSVYNTESEELVYRVENVSSFGILDNTSLYYGIDESDYFYEEVCTTLPSVSTSIWSLDLENLPISRNYLTSIDGNAYRIHDGEGSIYISKRVAWEEFSETMFLNLKNLAQASHTQWGELLPGESVRGQGDKLIFISGDFVSGNHFPYVFRLTVVNESGELVSQTEEVEALSSEIYKAQVLNDRAYVLTYKKKLYTFNLEDLENVFLNSVEDVSELEFPE